MEIGQLLKDLPSKDPLNFSGGFNKNHSKKCKIKAKKLTKYISTEDTPPEQIIIPDRSNVLLRHLYKQLDKKNETECMDSRDDSEDSCVDEQESTTVKSTANKQPSSSTASGDQPPRKLIRLTTSRDVTH